MSKRRPNGYDRDIVEWLSSLPVGEHRLVVETERAQAILKPEGGMIFSDPAGGKRITIYPAVCVERPADDREDDYLNRNPLVRYNPSPVFQAMKAARLQRVTRGTDGAALTSMAHPHDGSVIVYKPCKAKFAPNGIKLAEPTWLHDECTGRLISGTGCGNCLRCNREWHVLLRGPHERLGDGTVIKIESMITAERRMRGALVQAEAEKLAAEVMNRGMAEPQSSTISREELNRRYNPGLVVAMAEPHGDPDRYALNSWVEEWNFASRKGDKAVIARLDVQLRGMKFPPNVELTWERDADHHHGKQVVNDTSPDKTA